LAKRAKEGVRAAGGFPLEFGTISVSDGIAMGHEGMRASLVSREIIADSVECGMHAERFDGAVLLAGCDKSEPGMLMAAARLDLAAVFLYAGSTLPGRLDDRDLTIVDVFEGVGACALGRISREELDAIERAACPGEGACGGMFTANTMANAAEALGMSLPGSASPPAPDRRRDDYAARSGEAVVRLIDQGITARQILTRKAFENAIMVVMALGGSTNAVLHLLGIAHEARVPLSIDDFNRIGDRTPHLADVKPFGRYVMTDIDAIGGLPVVMKALLDAGLLHGDCLTVTGKSVAENLAEIAPPDPDGKIIHAMDNPIHKTGGLTILRGSLAPDGAVVESAGLEDTVVEGHAKAFDDERYALDALTHRKIQSGDAVVIRYEGPHGGQGMREMLAITGAIKGAGLGKEVLLITDGPVLRGYHRPVRRARRAGGVQGRPAGAGPRRRPDPARSAYPHPRPARRCRRTGPPAPVMEPITTPVSDRCPRQVRQTRRLRRPRRGLRVAQQRIPGRPMYPKSRSDRRFLRRAAGSLRSLIDVDDHRGDNHKLFLDPGTGQQIDD